MDIEVVREAAAGFPWISLVTGLPLLGALVLMAVPKENVSLLKGLTFFWTLLVFALSLGLWTGFDATRGDFQLTETKPWIEAFGILYAVVIDCISLTLVLLTTLLTPLIILGSWVSIQKRVKEFLICFLILETAMIGTLVALDIFLFYLFWELMLIPMYLLIGVWGGTNRIAAT